MRAESAALPRCRCAPAQRMASPVLADLAEQAMVDGVPLGGAAGVVADSDGELVRVNKAGLEGILETADAGSVAAAGVGEDQQFTGPGLSRGPHPPRAGRSCRRRRPPGRGDVRRPDHPAR